MQHEGGRADVHTGFRCRNLGGGAHLKDPGVDGRIILKLIFTMWDEDIEFNWPRKMTSGGLL
jgi:hypothetical protein